MLLPSCSKKVKKESVTPSRPNCTVSASVNGIEYTAKISYSDTGVMTVEMLNPLKGITIRTDDSGCRMSYDGMEIDCTTTPIQVSCPFINLYSVLKTVCYTVPESARSDGESYVLKYRTPELSCTAISRKNGTLCEIDAGNIKYTFK